MLDTQHCFGIMYFGEEFQTCCLAGEFELWTCCLSYCKQAFEYSVFLKCCPVQVWTYVPGREAMRYASDWLGSSIASTSVQMFVILLLDISHVISNDYACGPMKWATGELPSKPDGDQLFSFHGRQYYLSLSPRLLVWIRMGIAIEVEVEHFCEAS